MVHILYETTAAKYKKYIKCVLHQGQLLSASGLAGNNLEAHISGVGQMLDAGTTSTQDSGKTQRFRVGGGGGPPLRGNIM